MAHNIYDKCNKELSNNNWIWKLKAIFLWIKDKRKTISNFAREVLKYYILKNIILQQIFLKTKMYV